ncbi:MAG: permease prefix domain 1-containing protein [Lachnospiraceae bacterium]
METIYNYLDVMFASVEKTEQIEKMKADLAANMEDKYQELKAVGKSENEAIGTVIAEFGNVEELLKELGVTNRTEEVPQIQRTARTEEADYEDENGVLRSGIRLKKVTEQEVYEYMAAKQRMLRKTAAGVFIIMMGVAVMILLTHLLPGAIMHPLAEELGKVLPIVVLLVCVAAAVGLIINSGIRFSKYEYMEKGVWVDADLRNRLTKEMDDYLPTGTLALTSGVMLCILGVAVLLIMGAVMPDGDSGSVFGLCMMLVMVAIAVVLFITIVSKKDMYTMILGIGDYAPERIKENKLIGIVASVVWPLTAVVFFVWGFAFHGWRISWIVFPVVGICFGAFAAVCSAVTRK